MVDDVNVRLSLLEQDMQRANSSLVKLDRDAEKHREAHAQITDKIYTRIEDTRIELKEDMSELRTELKQDIETLKTSFETKFEEQSKVLDKISNKLDDLDKWRWIVMGIAAAAGFILSRLLSRLEKSGDETTAIDALNTSTVDNS